jgi:chorismate mutase / prephenate dehydrogenase
VSTPSDPVVKRIREQITENDLEIVGLLNKRLALVDELWRYKAAHGIDMYVPEREQWMVEFLTGANRGPLSSEALCEVYRVIVETSKAEATRLAES